jgi:hypothetical protein
MILPHQRTNRLMSDNHEDELHISTNKEEDNEKMIFKIDEDVCGNESDTPYPRKNRRDFCKSIKDRKRGLSSEDIYNINTYKLNTSAVL